MDASTVIFDENAADGNPVDILAKRMKNRERQRRYRAKKRNEADTQKALVVEQPIIQPVSSESQSTPMQLETNTPVLIEIPINAPSPKILARVHSQRDWKKDARSAHMHKKVEFRSNGHNESEVTFAGGNQEVPLQTNAISDLVSTDSNNPIIDNSGTQKLVSSRRNWKAAARNKKSSE